MTEKSASIVECLSNMTVNGEEGSFLDYTIQWISKVNRGGLFEVNDSTFALFQEIGLAFVTSSPQRLLLPLHNHTKNINLSKQHMKTLMFSSIGHCCQLI